MNKQEFEFCVRFRELGSFEAFIIGELIETDYIVASFGIIARKYEATHDIKTPMTNRVNEACFRLFNAGIITLENVGGKQFMMFLNDDWEKVLMQTPRDMTMQPTSKKKDSHLDVDKLDALYEKLKKGEKS